MSGSSMMPQSQHKKEESDTSITSVASSLVANARLTSRLESVLSVNEASPESTLRRGFSIKSFISTASTFARDANEAVEDKTLQVFRTIGQGSCGVIFEQVGLTHIAKRALSPDFHDLWNDFLRHISVNDAFSSLQYLGYTLRIPRCIGWRGSQSKEDHLWWSKNNHRFPQEYQTPGYLLFSERIMPLPSPIRQALIDLFCKEQIKESARISQGNESCLVRLYLGRRRLSTRPKAFFSLKNFPLHLDQMEDLGLDCHNLAKEMAFALSVMHWQARIDARDVEFVLGSEPNPLANTIAPPLATLEAMVPGSSTLPLGTGIDFQHRTVNIWLLDFNQCRKIGMDKEGVKECIDAFFINDPYYPRPGSTNLHDTALWDIFKTEYLKVTETVTKSKAFYNLACDFIHGVEDRVTLRLVPEE